MHRIELGAVLCLVVRARSLRGLGSSTLVLHLCFGFSKRRPQQRDRRVALSRLLTARASVLPLSLKERMLQLHILVGTRVERSGRFLLLLLVNCRPAEKCRKPQPTPCCAAALRSSTTILVLKVCKPPCKH